LGELASIGCAILWASSTVALRSQSSRIPVLGLNAIRAGYASLVFLGALAVLGQLDTLLEVSPANAAGLIGSVLIGMAVGDSLHFRAMTLIGVSRAMPVSSSYPIFTAVAAAAILSEPLTLKVFAGITLVVGGVYLVAMRVTTTDGQDDPQAERLGLALAFGASLCWAASTIIVKEALERVPPFTANGLRLPVAMVVLLVMARILGGAASPFGLGRRSGWILALAGLMSGVSGALWLVGVHEAGAAKAAVLSSTAPVFAAPMAALLLREQLTRSIVAGTMLTVVGIWLVL